MLRLKFAYCLLFAASAMLVLPDVASGVQVSIGRGAVGGLEEDDRPMARENKMKKKSKKKAKYVNLLESKDLSSFRGYKAEEIGEGWSIKGKSLYFDGTKGTGDIITKQTYSNFEMQFEWKISPGGNSGVMYRVGLGDAAPYMTGIEYQILDDTKHPDGKKAETSAGSVYALFAPKEYKKKAVGGWNKSRIVVDGTKITHVLNGTRVVEVDMSSQEWQSKVAGSKFKDWEKFAQEKSGHIAFQDHGNKVWYRNIKIRSNDEGAGLASDEPAAGRPQRGGRPASPGMLGAPGASSPGGKIDEDK
jgi:hypothetical protein